MKINLNYNIYLSHKISIFTRSMLVCFVTLFLILRADASKVLIVGAPKDLARNTEVAAKLTATGSFAQTDTFNAASSTPTLAQMQSYNAVLVYSDASFADATTLGNRLADYIDGGGGVVMATFSTNDITIGISGRILTGGYLPFSQGSQIGGSLMTMVADLTSHILLSGVLSFNGGSSSFHSAVSLASGATQVARWSDGKPLVMFKKISTKPVVALNFYPPSSTSRSDFWDATTGGASLMKNALNFAMGMLPTVTTSTSVSITDRSATLGGNVTSDGQVAITARGVVFSPTVTNSNPLIGGVSVINQLGTGTTGVFTVNTSNLTPGTAYTFKAYATNSVGTGYSTTGSFTTLAAPDIALEAPTGTPVTNGNGTLPYGSIVPGQTSDRLVIIRNAGTGATLESISASITGPDAGQFSLVTSPPATLASGASAQFTVRFLPTSLGAKTATLSIVSNDPDENPFTLALGGTGNTLPSFSGYAVSTPYETAATISLGKLLSAAADADGDTLSVTAAGPAATQGGTAQLQAGSILYTPLNGFSGSDTFQVTVTDSRGGSVTGTVTVAVQPDTGIGTNSPALTMLSGGRMGIDFYGIPGRSYEIQRSTNLTTWALLTTISAGTNGAVSYIDESPPPGSAFYRLRKP